MSRLNLVLDEKIERAFREEALKIGDLRKGSLKLAGEEAVRLWLAQRGRIVEIPMGEEKKIEI
ncbi:MAG: hypothetical protein ACYC7D_10440 [Nitrososphaerales archaeon]